MKFRSLPVPQCEWCEDDAAWEAKAMERPDYIRYACLAHIKKTQRLLVLDNGKDAQYEFRAWINPEDLI